MTFGSLNNTGKPAYDGPRSASVAALAKPSLVPHTGPGKEPLAKVM